MKDIWDERTRILVIAPRCSATQAIVRRLRSEGFVVDVAPTPQQAFARVDLVRYDIVVGHQRIDRSRREMLAELARFVRRRRPQAGLIEISGCTSGPGDECCEAAPFRARSLACRGANSLLVQSVLELIQRAVSAAGCSSPHEPCSDEFKAANS
ncbi:MAG: hypothetical protein N3C12_07740 [Candidatus Binatia bacterium]|nr:hypothetical protein [Candidatus Binatia bacterium]